MRYRDPWTPSKVRSPKIPPHQLPDCLACLPECARRLVQDGLLQRHRNLRVGPLRHGLGRLAWLRGFPAACPCLRHRIQPSAECLGDESEKMYFRTLEDVVLWGVSWTPCNLPLAPRSRVQTACNAPAPAVEPPGDALETSGTYGQSPY